MERLSSFGLFSIVVILFTACTDRQSQPPQAQSLQAQSLQARLDSLDQRLRHTYTPGFGEMMLNIQIHHAKLWFAGSAGNWELAAYDESLVRSAFRKIRTYHPDDPNTAALSMIDGPMDSVGAAISLKSAPAFRRSFVLLTATCNNCHAVTKHPFNVITIPQHEPIGNQLFSLKPGH
jgi:hypothetical protein